MLTSVSVSDNARNIDASNKQYKIKDTLESASAFIFIAYDQKNAGQTVVLKILREYKDERYHYATPEERLTCQCEALRKNRMITPDIYQGLRLIVGLTLKKLEEKVRKGKLQSIILGEIAEESDQHECQDKQDREYALVMSYLPEKQRLDLLLRTASDEKLKELLKLLVIRIKQMHESFPPPGSQMDEYGNFWGSNKQLQEKLEHNLTHFDFIKRYEPMLYEQYSKLKRALRLLIQVPELQDAFMQRQSKYVKQCHGDLKARNIWIETIEQNDNPLQYVSILDAVDFNESYRNIDMLADVAMLVVDIEANRTSYYDHEKNEQVNNLISYVITEYFSLREKENDRNQIIVLRYYLIEKAIVCAIMCLVYDRGERSLGECFLRIANKYALTLSDLIEPSCKQYLL